MIKLSNQLLIKDEEVFNTLQKEIKRQTDHLELIASENYVSENVLEVTGSVLTNKYAEGYPNKRYYGGCDNVDTIENLAIERLKKLFNVKYANVQPHSGSSANMACYRALLNKGDIVMGMSLESGGHLTHGYKLSFSGEDYTIYPYYVNPDTGLIDYDELALKVKEIKPKMIIAGGSAYPREIDFKRFKEIALSVNAYLMVDMAHIAGLVACNLHNSPIPYADVVTSTTHKTLRGPRGGIIMTNNEEIIKKINRTVFPGIQGGPLMHIIGAKAVAFKEDLDQSFILYQKQVILNAKTLAQALINKGYKLITGGTDNHLMLVDVKTSLGLTGKTAETILDQVNITCNKNTIPNDTEKPAYASGIRLGTPAITTRGLKEKDMEQVAEWINQALRNKDNQEKLNHIKAEVTLFLQKFPITF